MNRIILAILLSASLIGCGQSKPAKDEPPPAAPSLPVHPAKRVVKDDDGRLAQTFTTATVQEPPEGESCPPEETVTHKSVGKIYEAVAGHGGKGGLWDKIFFLTADNRPINYRATLHTELGSIAIDLRPDVAPNHVRSFIALAKSGYYKGLAFDRAIRQKIEVDTGKEGKTPEVHTFDYLEAGCPLGTGDPGFGSVGYWLKPEFSDKVSHEIGSVGACHGEELESGSAKFYITLTNAPWMDGNWTIFGKVTQGMDVVRKIFDKPKDDDFRPRQPVVIRDVTITSSVR